MDARKQEELGAAAWVVGGAEEFQGLSEDIAAAIAPVRRSAA